MKEVTQEGRITFDEYREMHSSKRNASYFKSIAVLIAISIGFVIALLLALTDLKIYQINEYAGYIAIGVSVLLFIFLYIFPVVRTFNKRQFVVDVNDMPSAAKAKKHNRRVRREIANEIIDLHRRVDDKDIYDKVRVGELAMAINRNDDVAINDLIKMIYDTDVKKAVKKEILIKGLEVSGLTALMQDNAVNTAVLGFFETNLIKSIVFLYGFRTSDRQMMKIYRKFAFDVMISYGLSTLADTIFHPKGTVDPITNLIGTLIASGVKGLSYGAFTISVGIKTKKVLVEEYRLQEIIDGFEFEEDENEVKELTKELKEARKTKKTLSLNKQ